MLVDDGMAPICVGYSNWRRLPQHCKGKNICNCQLFEAYPSTFQQWDLGGRNLVFNNSKRRVLRRTIIGQVLTQWIKTYSELLPYPLPLTCVTPHLQSEMVVMKHQQIFRSWSLNCGNSLSLALLLQFLSCCLGMDS